MFTLFTDISMTLEQICSFKTSVIAEMSLYKFEAAFILQSTSWIQCADTCTHVCIYNIEDEKMRRTQWIMSFLYTSIVKWFMVEYFYVVCIFPPHQRKNISFKKFQISGKKIVLTKSYMHSFTLNLFSSSICVSISSFSENRREGGEGGEIQRRE